MKTFWTPYISDHTINAICWTLIHSLWIGLAAALLTGLVITFTRKSAAALRYRLLCGILVLFVAAAGITFYIQMRFGTPVQLSPGKNIVIIGPVSAVGTDSAAPATHTSLFTGLTTLIKQNTSIIFLVWLLFFVLKSLKMVSGLLYIQRIRNYKVHVVAGEVKQKVQQFSEQLGISRAVRLMQSELVKVPVAVGWLKPVILLPVGIVLQLSAEQLESILWHELAHIRRRDYLVNILQGLVETVFFFNPALLWLSSLIRAEREACCDDMVLSRMNRKANYLEALLAFGYEDTSRTSLVMSIGSGSQLRDRLKRMVSQENKRLSIAEKAVLAASLILLSAFTALPKADNAVQYLSHLILKNPVKAALAKHRAVGTAAKKQPVFNYAAQHSGDTTIKKHDTTIHITSVLYSKNNADPANTEMSVKDDKGDIYDMVVANNKLTSLRINGTKVDDSKLADYDHIVREVNQQVAEKRRFMADDMAGFKPMSSKAKFKMKDWADTGKVKLRLGWTKPDSGFTKLKLLSDKPFPQKMTKQEWLGLRLQQDSAGYTADQVRANAVIADLVAEKVVASATAVKWFGLSNDELIVNGQKQPDALHDKLKAKYGISEDNGLYYGPVKMTGKGVFVDDEPHIKFQQHSLQKLMLKQQQFAMNDMKFKPMPKKMWAPDKQFMMKQKNLLKLDQQHNGFFKSNFSLNEVISSVTDDLVGENVIKDKSDLSSFKLTNTFLMVNGKKQPDDIHEKLKEKYLDQPGYSMDRQITRDPHFGIHYTKSGSMGIGIDVDRDDP
ncbi:M56 family metallopeptidase [Mucilaginibacter ginsenosidivorans]|uniref:M56 family metallopeptidase n=1 Tax=Mucilaginibacter ginsenosidivorans TaxID=398053 RepID=A0A5B8V1S9_9SPHI|nr:M56 family metallopeptidase [Mucilaginibacter ginsenosidivorans]QEC65390.1 M56 family metallopeptidase [Mucilaginibacter ginsenosidivorans]